MRIKPFSMSFSQPAVTISLIDCGERDGQMKSPEQTGFVRVTTGIAHFPKELPFPPRVWIERGYNVQHWTEMPRGGHLAAAEEPEHLAEDLRAFFRRFR
jgi:hypothetical protein